MHHVNKIVSATLIFLGLAEAGAAQNDMIGQLTVSRAISPLRIDGSLDEDAWNGSASWDDFLQAQPAPGALPSLKTEIKMLYDDENLYVGVVAFDSAGRYNVMGLQRDKYYRNEDGISIMLDTYNDKIHALLLFSNVLGARFDEEVSDNGTGFNAAYNTFWDVETHQFDGGYSCEFVIPFSSLRFRTEEVVVMGFKVVRQIGRNNEAAIFPKCNANLSNIVWRVNSEAEIVFRDLKALTPVYVTPYIKADYREENQLNAEGNAYVKSTDAMTRNNFLKNEAGDRALSSVGVDAKIGVSKNFTLDATLNTDFAQAEADNRIFNYTRFNISLPEKRQFFLEANDYFNFSVAFDGDLFNSRNIGIENGKIIPIVGGLRLTGKSSGLQLGAMDIQTQGLKSASVNPENFSVVHLHKDLFKNGSFCSGFFANRMTTNVDSISNQTLGVDFLHRLSDTWTYGLNIVGTHDLNQANTFDKNMIYNAALIRQVLYGYSNFISFTKSERNFNPMSGFYADHGYYSAYAFDGYTFKIKNSKLLNYFDLSSEIYFKWRDTDVHYLETNSYILKPTLGFKSGLLLSSYCTVYNHDFVPYDWHFSEHITIPGRFYYLPANVFTFESAKKKRLLYQLIITTDKFYDGQRIALAPQVSGGINKHLAIKLDYLFTDISFPAKFSDDGNGHFHSDLISAAFIYSFTTQTSFNTLIQYDNVSKTVGANFRFRYNPKEGTDLYVVYNPSANTRLTRYTPELPQMAQQVLIIKFTKTFSVKHI